MLSRSQDLFLEQTKPLQGPASSGWGKCSRPPEQAWLQSLAFQSAQGWAAGGFWGVGLMFNPCPFSWDLHGSVPTLPRGNLSWGCFTVLIHRLLSSGHLQCPVLLLPAGDVWASARPQQDAALGVYDVY